MLVLLAPCIFDATGCSPGLLRTSLCDCAPTRACTLVKAVVLVGWLAAIEIYRQPTNQHYGFSQRAARAWDRGMPWRVVARVQRARVPDVVRVYALPTHIYLSKKPCDDLCVCL